MKSETIVKSIIYGNSSSNNYGVFRALCAAITEKEHIDKIIFYLRAAENFRKYNKYVYAFRLEDSKGLFVTQPSRNQGQKDKQYIEGFNEDTTLQGNGEKLLHLLQKFNVRNVLVIVAISQKDPLSEFNAQHYRTVVKCAKDLLKSLYDRVLKAEDREPLVHQLPKQAIPRKLYVLPELFKPSKFTKVERMQDNNRPNYVGLEFRRTKVDKKILRRKMDIKYLDTKIKELAYSLQNLIEDFGEKENTIIKFAIQYDKSPLSSKIIRALCLLLQVEDRSELLQQEIGTLLKKVTSSNISNRVITELNMIMLGDKQLTQAKADAQNKVMGMVFQFLSILLKSYSYAKQIAILEAESENAHDSQSSRLQKSQSKLSEQYSQRSEHEQELGRASRLHEQQRP